MVDQVDFDSDSDFDDDEDDEYSDSDDDDDSVLGDGYVDLRELETDVEEEDGPPGLVPSPSQRCARRAGPFWAEEEKENEPPSSEGRGVDQGANANDSEEDVQAVLVT